MHIGQKLVPHHSWTGHLKKEKHISSIPKGSNIKKKKRCKGPLCGDKPIIKQAQIPQSDDYCEECFTYDIKKALSWRV